MYYPQQPPPPQYPPQYYGPQYSGCLKFVLYALSFFIPLVGIILGIVYMSKPDPESKSLGKICLIISIVVIVIGCCLGGIFGILPIILQGTSGY
jgi:hypothetical protein